jgi:hypothetical protein
MEHVDYPGNIGDSCAETCRAIHLKNLLNEETALTDEQFVTYTGVIRHPTAPIDWRETDATTDQVLPLYLTSGLNKEHIRSIIKLNNWRTGNGDFVSPIFFCLLNNLYFLFNLCIIAQLLLFKLPWRWSDAYNKFEPMKDSSADYLNFIHCVVYASPLVKKFINKTVLKIKIRDYYKKEPNVYWLIELYDRVIDIKL